MRHSSQAWRRHYSSKWSAMRRRKVVPALNVISWWWMVQLPDWISLLLHVALLMSNKHTHSGQNICSSSRSRRSVGTFIKWIALIFYAGTLLCVPHYLSLNLDSLEESNSFCGFHIWTITPITSFAYHLVASIDVIEPCSRLAFLPTRIIELAIRQQLDFWPLLPAKNLHTFQRLLLI